MKTNGFDFEEVSAKTADKVESAIKNFGKKIADKKFKKTSSASSTTTANTTQQEQPASRPGNPVHL